jgi:hypothetical protein
MKKWLFILVHAVEMAILLGAVYFEPSHCIRGLVHREHFYQGRPTSYWRSMIDCWIDQHGSEKNALSTMTVVHAKPATDGDVQEVFFEFTGGGLMVLRAPTLWERIMQFVGTGRDDIVIILDPAILTNPVGGEEVLRELAREDRYRAIAERALQNARLLRAAKRTNP